MTPAVLELTGIEKRYGPVRANHAVDLRVARGTVHAIVGENGAGKSTLMRIAYGHVKADAGMIKIKGEVVDHHSVAQSLARGLGMVHQHFMLVRPLTVVENLVLGREPTRARFFLDLARAERELVDLSRRFGLAVHPRARVEELGVGEQQRVEILKVLWQGCDVLILDEPTAVLTPGEVRELFQVLRGLVADGMTVVLITHKLDEVLAIADEVTVMRRGEVVATMPRAGLRAEDIATAMVGRPVLLRVDKGPPKPPPADAPLALEVKDLLVTGSRGVPAVRGVSLEVRPGEIVGVAGVEGNGQSELVEALVGLRRIDAGTVTVAGRDLTSASVYARYAAGVGHVPEDRHDRALVLDYSVRDNLILGQQRAFASRGLLDDDRIDRHAAQLVTDFEIRPPTPSVPASGLSGGNQQKVVIARELGRERRALLVCAQPTRGVDIGAIEAIHRRMVAERDRGVGILLVSAELNELRALSDRLLVLYRGRVAAELGPAELHAEDALDRIGCLMTGAEAGAADGEEAR